MNKVVEYHNDTIKMNAQKDRNLMHQAVKLRESVQGCVHSANRITYRLATVKLERDLTRFIKVFGAVSSQTASEVQRRELETPRVEESELSKDLFHQIGKINEGIESCVFRYKNPLLIGSTNSLKKSLNKFALQHAKYGELKKVSPSKNHTSEHEM